MAGSMTVKILTGLLCRSHVTRWTTASMRHCCRRWSALKTGPAKHSLKRTHPLTPRPEIASPPSARSAYLQHPTVPPLSPKKLNTGG
ncbi:hypothetical protein DPEC_G00018790 [Dallia pectoralis]|uniref:Uncharacterized protein n=1 Tax=Dallia pectoralis TaxID=75939 RepID=A0ACC2HFT9_DALPE|nr:hypothetical protein DPEC_G00018790 [Dallia pectoralis]